MTEPTQPRELAPGIKPIVGEKLFVVIFTGYTNDPPSNQYPVTVTAVGQKYFTVAADGMRLSQFAIANWARREGTGNCAYGAVLYASEAAYKAKIRRGQLVDRCRAYNWHGATLAELEAVHAIICPE